MKKAAPQSLARHRRVRDPGGVIAALTVAAGFALSPVASADPSVIPLFEGQFGTIPVAGEDVVAASFWVFAAGPTEIPYALRIVDGDEVDIEKDVLHQPQSPVEIDERPASYFTVDKLAPATAPWLDPADDLAGVLAYAEDGTQSGTESVVVAIIPALPGGPTYVTLDDIPTFIIPDEQFNKTGVAADGQGNITVVFTEFSMPGGGTPKVRAQRMSKTGTPIGGFFDITDDLHTAPDIALLDTNGDALVVAHNRRRELQHQGQHRRHHRTDAGGRS